MIIENVTSNGANVTSSLAGGLSINEANGEIVIRNGLTEVVRIDKEGFKYYDAQGTERIKFGQNANGQQQIIVYGTNGKSEILIGQNPKTGAPILAVGKPGRDVIQDLNS